eukprot:Platyproteum_vivax@DN7648_c2_g1_i15.p1
MGFRTYRFAEPKVPSVSDMDDDATSDGVEVISGEPVTLTTSLTPLQPSVTSQKSSCAESVASKGPFKALQANNQHNETPSGDGGSVKQEQEPSAEAAYESEADSESSSCSSPIMSYRTDRPDVD